MDKLTPHELHTIRSMLVEMKEPLPVWVIIRKLMDERDELKDEIKRLKEETR